MVAIAAAASTDKEAKMKATGSFEVQVIPQPAAENTTQISHLLLNKQFHGDLEGTSNGQMLGAMTAIPGSGAGVALELFSGTLNGKHGSFILQHKSTMQNGAYHMDITVVPDSGTDEFTGITGVMQIIIEGDKHRYEFEYTLTPPNAR